MKLLVDGHNLIGQLPNVSLADEDDEAQLVMLLRRYAAARRGRRVFVVFDGGVYGHPTQLDGYGVSCSFARSPSDADEQLVQRLRALDKPREWTLVSSDRAVTRVAEERGVKVIGSRAFGALLLQGGADSGSKRRRGAPPPEPRVSDAEVREWLRLFGLTPDEPES